jgi:hypothetical protein
MTGSDPRRVAFGIASLCAATLWGGVAKAEPTAMDKAAARTWMAEGRTRRSQRNFEGALQSFKAADGVMRVPTTGLEVARTLDAMGHLLEARAKVRRVLSIPVTSDDPAPFQEAMSAAAALDADLDQRIPTVTFVVQGSGSKSTPSIWVDGQPIAPSEITTPLRLDPGTHQIVARVGQLDATQSIELHERDRQPVVLRVPGAVRGSSADSEAKTNTWRTITYASFGTSAAALLVGTVTGAIALSTKHTAQQSCVDGRCPPETWDTIERAHQYATVSTVCFATFGAALGIGFTSLALAPTREPTSGGGSIRPRVGLGYAALEGTF